ncbi:MAG: hypothetical protein KJ043_22405, partial [Anaerolineae bacterium]|nr:hypothetical protein [Anaerolineae bacterium]
ILSCEMHSIVSEFLIEGHSVILEFFIERHSAAAAAAVAAVFQILGERHSAAGTVLDLSMNCTQQQQQQFSNFH